MSTVSTLSLLRKTDKNEASAISVEDGKKDRFMLEHFPVNRLYGYCVDRASNVTIVSTSSRAELCTGNFANYLAKFAGFNYISKEFNAADGESYNNNHWEYVDKNSLW